MQRIYSTQIKMARAYLGWSQEELSEATGVGISTIRKMETGHILRGKTTEAICRAIEKEGLEFVEPEGVRRRSNDVELIKGQDSVEIFFEAMLKTVREEKGEIASMMASQELLASSIGCGQSAKFERLMRLNTHADILCLLPDTASCSLTMPEVRFRRIEKDKIGLAPTFIYGKKHAVVVPNDDEGFQFVVFHSSTLTFSYRAHFLSLWKNAIPCNGSSAQN